MALAFEAGGACTHITAGGACTHSKGGACAGPVARKRQALAFEQQPRESDKAFAAFSLYLSQGPERSLAKVAKELGKAVRLIEGWSRKWDWQVRVAAHGAHLAVVEREAIEVAARGKAAEWASREQRLRETEWSMHERAISAAERAFTAFMEREKVYANLADIARMLEIASKLGRLATGLDTDGERKRSELPAVRVEVKVALEKIYGQAEVAAPLANAPNPTSPGAAKVIDIEARQLEEKP